MRPGDRVRVSDREGLYCDVEGVIVEGPIPHAASRRTKAAPFHLLDDYGSHLIIYPTDDVEVLP